ncbi:MAG TPA: ABC transporter permease [Stellaceae bacterium]|nr:ABC transporter permease [Stellaceae bacterium]
MPLDQQPASTLDFASALSAGELDACVHCLRSDKSADTAAAERNCRLAEALFHGGKHEEALECGRRAFAIAGDHGHILDFCAWLFSNSGCHRDAAEAYRRLVDLRPGWAEGYRHASGSMAAAGALGEAIAYAVRASELAPYNAEFAIHAAELLQRTGRFDEAAAVLAAAMTSDGAPDPVLLRVLSGIEMLRGRIDSALAAIEQAIAAVPDRAEYHLHRAHLLRHRHEHAAAAAAIAAAAALAPDDAAVRRARVELLAAEGRLAAATALAGELLRDFPEDDAAAETTRHVIDLRRDTPGGDDFVITRSFRPKRPLRPPPSLLARLNTQRRVIRALVIRETRTRFGDSKLGYGWALLEPILHIALLSVVFALLMHGTPPIGTEFFIFYFTGLIPYHVFVHSSGAMTFAVTGNAPLLQLPLVTTFDVILARGLLEFVTDIIVAVLLLIGFAAIGLHAMPIDFLSPTITLIVTAVLGFGIGFINAVVAVFIRSWDRLYAQITRTLYFCSGIFYVPGMMPDWVLDLLGWNPILHAIDWFRSGFFDNYQPHWLDRRYLLLMAVSAILAGLALHAGLRRKLSEPL